MAGHPGYLLPDGDAYTDELACCLVFYPDKPEYRRALLGSLVYLSTWLAWERDEEKRGKDAARAWKDAVDETLECWNMTCLEELIADVSTIRLLMETKKDCCDSSTTYYPTDFPTTDIEPLVGDPPEFYGETAVSDWEDWAEHVCHNAHIYVDYLKDTAEELQEAVQLSSIFIGLIGATLALLAFSGIGLPIAFALTAGIVAGLVLGATSLTFQDTADDFETARDLIVCAILNGASLSSAVQVALESGTDWDLFYQFVDYDSAIAILYEGGYETEYLPSETRDDCNCAAFENFVFTWDSNVDGWISGGGIIWEWNAGGWLECRNANDHVYQSRETHRWTELATKFSFDLPIFYDQVRFRFQNDSGSGSAVRFLFTFGISDSEDVRELSQEWDTNDFSADEWHDIVWNLSEIFESGVNEHAIYMKMYMYAAPSQGQRLWLDDFGVYLK